jgi:hypothetical protein
MSEQDWTERRSHDEHHYPVSAEHARALRARGLRLTAEQDEALHDADTTPACRECGAWFDMLPGDTIEEKRAEHIRRAHSASL